MSKKLRYGIIGCGGIANGKHLPALKKVPDVEIVAFCDIIPARAEKANKEYSGGKGKVFENYKDLLKEDLDAVFVLTPNNSHSEISVAALNSGKNVMCEKPMAKNYKEAQAMIAARDASKKLLTIGYQSRYRPDSLYLKEEVDSGALGEIYFAKATAIRRRAVPTWGVFLDEEKQGGGPLIDIGTHALDLTLFMMNNYEPAYAVGTVYHKLNKDKRAGNAWGDWDPKKFTVEDSAFGFVVMKNGATIILQSSWALNISTDVREAVTTLCGTKAGADMAADGTLTINGVKNGRQYVQTPNLGVGGVAFYDGAASKPEDAEALTFANAIRGKGKLYVLPEQAAVVTRILEGIYISAKSGKAHYFD
ncbi:Gfo/Idh/MocA family protein [Leadbettera azotonutricia]|uniref:Oxidoreductase domain protein n=1 Tax=Leadbettera azotonutricia (strain ATCC BAA-888 / DSM 13862 / ZAS-9) TaxID=545695 RepID=F5YBB8_LEAAZ|nr:Gfo/Idh/MocA family oxidoreductase [Leadbettera azotonutricia]AEF80231.1 oxidoreductase domain protein [Leadbettera azotonutricia ZAS-9]